MLLPFPARSDCMVEDMERLEVGGGRETSAFIIVCRGMESIEYAPLRWLRTVLEFCLDMASGAGRTAPREGEIDDRADRSEAVLGRGTSAPFGLAISLSSSRR